MKANTEQSLGENAQTEPRLQVLSDSAAASRRIVGALDGGGLAVAHVLSAPDEIDASSIDASTIFVFVCDVDEASGMAGLRRLRRTQGDPAIVVISPPATGTGVRRALDAGADAIVFEPEIETTLAVTTLAVASGQSVVPRKLRASVEKPAFSHRERQVLALVSRGLTNSEIAERLLLAQSTVKSHLSSAFTKLGIRSRKEVTALMLDPEQAQSVGLIGVGVNTAAPETNGNGSLTGHNAIPSPSRERHPLTSGAAPQQAGGGVPFIRLDAADPVLTADVFAAIERVAAGAAFTLGEELETFEREFADWCETEHAIGVSSGTSALELTMRALGIGPGDEVIVPTNSFIATAEAVTATGATPILVDVDADTALITAEIVEAALTERTRCVIPVHLYGRSVEMGPLLTLCRSRGLRLIEDACQAHGAVYQTRRAGTHGDAGCFSFYPTKNLGGWGDGGAVVTADAELAERIRLMRSHGEGTRHHHEVASGTHRLHSLQAAILSVKLKRLDEWNEQRRQAGNVLRDALSDCDLLLPAPVAPDGDHVYHLFVVRTPDRDALREHLGASNVASAIHYPTPIHLQPAYAGTASNPGELPVSERLASESCSLPTFPSITDEELDRIATAVSSFSA